LTERGSIAEVAGVSAEPNSDYGTVILYSDEHNRIYRDPAVARRLDNLTEFYFARFEQIKVPWRDSACPYYIAVFPRLPSGNYEVGEYSEERSGDTYLLGLKLITVYPGNVTESKHYPNGSVPWD